MENREVRGAGGEGGGGALVDTWQQKYIHVVLSDFKTYPFSMRIYFKTL